MTNLTEKEIFKVREILTERWVISNWTKKLDEFDEVFKKMILMLKKFEKRIKIIEEKIND